MSWAPARGVLSAQCRRRPARGWQSGEAVARRLFRAIGAALGLHEERERDRVDGEERRVVLAVAQPERHARFGRERWPSGNASGHMSTG